MPGPSASSGEPRLRKCRRVALRAAVLFPWTIAFSAYAGVGYSSYEGACEYPDYLGSMLVSPELRLGEFRIVLPTPDYRDSATIQKHLAFSTVLANLLSTELRDRTKGLCEATITPSLYPDLKAFLFSTSDLKQGDRSICARALREAVSQSRPSEKAIKAIADLKAKTMVQKKSDPGGFANTADAILVNSLAQIYDVDTVMHALVSVDERAFQSIDPHGFIEWLDNWRTSGLDEAVQIRTNCKPEIDGRSLSVTKLSSRLPYSAAIPSGLVKISMTADSIRQSRVLRHAMIADSDIRPNLPLSNPAAEKYCNREHVFPVDGKLQTTVIRCLSETFYYIDSWTIFYVEPREEISEDAVEKIMTAIANDPDVLELAQGNRKEEKPRGPYLVEVQVTGE